VRHELEAYDAGLTEKAEIVVLSKIDTVDAETLKTQVARLRRAAKRTPLRVSAVTHENLDTILRAVLAQVDQPSAEQAAQDLAAEWHP
jgi:GTP-binding protein